MVALWAVTTSFFAKAFDAGYADDWRHHLGDVIGERPLISRSWLIDRVRSRWDFSGHIAECGAPPEDDELGEEIRWELQHLVTESAQDLVTDLIKVVGEADLFASMWSAGIGEEPITYPLGPAAMDEIVNPSHLTGQMLNAYHWLVDEMALG
ncbi:hypothetical protein [Nocardia transvalensis]|uniref:hypothetical protein n=1 Tax=Nocardia transvalensis TaxID=37333 RepID=UPI0018932C20|nr:hypothetical protein [Nocardia transvalensis]MBF6333300.1 hypothetical protein [Nocardia transvalensis]